MSKKSKEIFGEPIKEFKLPLIERVAYYRPFLVWLIWAGLTAMIVGPTIYYNYENLWYYFLIAPVVIFLVIAIINLIRFIHCSIKCNKKISETVENDHHFDTYAGPPGTGKTFTAVFLQYEKAKHNWEELQYEFWEISKKLRNEEYKPTIDEQEIIDAYKFYTTNPGVPCYSTNIPVYSKRYRRYAYDAGADYLKQQERAPYRLCSVYDEIGTVCSVEMKDGRKTNNCGATDLSDTFKFCRHLNLWSIVGCEQDPGNIYIDARRVASENRIYLGKEWILKPRFLLWVYDKLKTHFLRKMSLKEAYFCSGFMQRFKKYINACGYFKFRYKIVGNTETAVGPMMTDTGERDIVYIPRANEVVYRTRAFREAYKAKEKPIEIKAYNSLYMTTARARSMLKSENLVIKNQLTKEKCHDPKPKELGEPSDVLRF